MPVRTLRIEKTTSKEPLDFEQWVEKGVYDASTFLNMREQMPGRWLCDISPTAFW